MKVKRYIAGLLLLCFSVFLGHNLVPHHHHSEALHNPIVTDCPFDHGDHQEHDYDSEADTEAEEQPVHCHAFNNVLFDKYNLTLNNPGTGQVLAMMVSGQTSALEEMLMLTSSLFPLLKLPAKSLTDLGTRALRGPPAFA